MGKVVSMTKKPRAEKAANLPAVPHEPTPAEKRAVASYEKRKAALPKTPPLTYTITDPDENGVRNARITVDHPDHATGYQMISDAIGTGDMAFTCGLLLDASGVGTKRTARPTWSARTTRCRS